MSDKDEQPDAGVDDFDKAARLNFRDYPSTSLVMIAALRSGMDALQVEGPQACWSARCSR